MAVPCVILGAGPAGLSAALWCRRLGIEAVVLEARSRLGGELGNINLPIHDLLGVTAASGREFLASIEKTLDAQALGVRFEHGVQSLNLAACRVGTEQGDFTYRCLIVATGLRRRRLTVEGAEALLGRGLSYSATDDLLRLAGKTVAVLGSGDGAYENALILADRCPHVMLLQRYKWPRARPEFVQRVHDGPGIEVLAQVDLRGLQLAADGSVRLSLQQGGQARDLSVDWLVAKIGFEPCSELLRGQLDLDEGGYVIVDRWLQTSRPRVFAAGDISNPRAPSIAAAIGDGAVAARGVFDDLRQRD